MLQSQDHLAHQGTQPGTQSRLTAHAKLPATAAEPVNLAYLAWGCFQDFSEEPIREVLESAESDVIHYWALDSVWGSARCGSPNTA